MKNALSPETIAEIARVTRTPGFWIMSDSLYHNKVRDVNIPLVSDGTKICALKIDAELQPEKFLNTARFMGPYRTPRIATIALPKFSVGQEKLRLQHGTPAEFAIACYGTVPGFCSMDEARVAIDKYCEEWNQTT